MKITIGIGWPILICSLAFIVYGLKGVFYSIIGFNIVCLGLLVLAVFKRK